MNAKPLKPRRQHATCGRACALEIWLYIARFIVLYIIGAKIRIFLGLCKSWSSIFFLCCDKPRSTAANKLSQQWVVRHIMPRHFITPCHTYHATPTPCDTVTLWHCDNVILGVVLSVLITLITRNNTTPTPCDNVISWFCDLGVRVGRLTNNVMLSEVEASPRHGWFYVILSVTKDLLACYTLSTRVVACRLWGDSSLRSEWQRIAFRMTECGIIMLLAEWQSMAHIARHARVYLYSFVSMCQWPYRWLLPHQYQCKVLH